MRDVYYIPDLQSKIICLAQATKSGCDIRLKGECMTMHDQDGKLLVKATRSKNRLYKVHMGIKDNICLLSTATNTSNRWHARLGHVNFETIQSMVQRELVTGIPRMTFEKSVCGSCLLGKYFHKLPHTKLIQHLSSSMATCVGL